MRGDNGIGSGVAEGADSEYWDRQERGGLPRTATEEDDHE